MYFPEIIPGHNSPQMKDREIIAFTQVSANDDTQDNVELEVGEELEALQQEDDHIIVPTSSRCSRRRGFFAVILLSVLIFIVLVVRNLNVENSDRGVEELSADRLYSDITDEEGMTAAEKEAVFILTVEEDGWSRISSLTAASLRHSLQGLAMTLLSIRPALQRDLWQTIVPPNTNTHPPSTSDTDTTPHNTAQTQASQATASVRPQRVVG